jgi:quercetin dioxygenase-like cupin family protein
VFGQGGVTVSAERHKGPTKKFGSKPDYTSRNTEAFTMAIPHATPGQVINIGPLGSALSKTVTTTLIKSDGLEVIRLVVPAGKVIPSHKVAGEITVQCLEGRVAFTALGEARELQAGQMCYLSGGEEHSLKGLEDSSVLVTILL